jgi:hypothetical protein
MYLENMEVSRMFATATSAIKETKTSIEPVVKQQHSLNWLAVTMFGLLMIYPFVSQYVPIGIRAYLAASLK